MFMRIDEPFVFVQFNSDLMSEFVNEIKSNTNFGI